MMTKNSWDNMIQPKRVAIIGAGPSGLVTAKVLLHHFPKGRFEPIVFEKKPSVGGLWAVGPDSSTSSSSFINPSMRTNQSRFTVCFSDFAWESISGDEDGTSVPMFPPAWQVGRYLERYTERYIPRDALRLGCRILRTERQPPASLSSPASGPDDGTWLVDWAEEIDISKSDGIKKTHSERFDYLVVASGFFSRPHIPDIPGLESLQDRVIHSSVLHNMQDLLHSQEGAKEGKLVVVGGSISGAEAASALALYLSSTLHAPGSSNEQHQNCTVHHISPRPFWVVPTYLPVPSTEEPSRSFLPLDLVMYDLSRRPPGAIEYSFGPDRPQRSVLVNQYFENILGTDQSDLNAGLALSDTNRERPPWIAVTDNYAEFVRSGEVDVTIGRVCALHRSTEGSGTLEIELTNGERSTLKDVTAIVLATGFTPFDSLSFLPQDVLSILEYSDNDSIFPLILDGKGISHAQIPNLGFVGMYRGPFWGVMEMQARSLAQEWNRQINQQPGDGESKKREERQQVRNLRSVDPRVAHAQFPMGDYVGLMESFARDLRIERLEMPGQVTGERSGPVIPARYQAKPASSADRGARSDSRGRDVTRVLNSVQSMLSHTSEEMRQLSTAKVIFRALQGKWKFSRTLKTQSDTSAMPSTGHAIFHPRYPSEAGYDGEYLYEEVSDGRSPSVVDRMTRFIYRFREIASDTVDHIGVWTAGDKDGDGDGTLAFRAANQYSHGFHFIDRDQCEHREHPSAMIDNHHLHGKGISSVPELSAINDPQGLQYHYTHSFRIKGVSITSWQILVHSSPVGTEERAGYDPDNCKHWCQTVYCR